MPEDRYSKHCKSTHSTTSLVPLWGTNLVPTQSKLHPHLSTNSLLRSHIQIPAARTSPSYQGRTHCVMYHCNAPFALFWFSSYLSGLVYYYCMCFIMPTVFYCSVLVSCSQDVQRDRTRDKSFDFFFNILTVLLDTHTKWVYNEYKRKISTC